MPRAGRRSLSLHLHRKPVWYDNLVISSYCLFVAQMPPITIVLLNDQAFISSTLPQFKLVDVDVVNNTFLGGACDFSTWKSREPLVARSPDLRSFFFLLGDAQLKRDER